MSVRRKFGFSMTMTFGAKRQAADVINTLNTHTEGNLSTGRIRTRAPHDITRWEMVFWRRNCFRTRFDRDWTGTEPALNRVIFIRDS